MNECLKPCEAGIISGIQNRKADGKMKIAKNTVVTVHYKLSDAQNNLLEDGQEPIVYLHGGYDDTLPALEKALDTMRRAVAACDEAGYGDCILCPETMGKINQLGTVDEVLALCAVDPRITPCIDFGHIYARSGGAELTDTASYAALLDKLGDALGDDRAVHFHAHFSRIAYTAGGEKCHLTFADTAYGPPHAPLLQLLKQRKLAPTIICESAGTQAEDAQKLAAAFAAL